MARHRRRIRVGGSLQVREVTWIERCFFTSHQETVGGDTQTTVLMKAPPTAFGHDRRPVLFEVAFEFGHTDAIDAGSAFVLGRPLIHRGCRQHPCRSANTSPC